MAAVVMDPSTRQAMDQLSTGLDALAVAGVEPLDRDDAVALIRELEVIQRRLRCAQVELITAVDQRGIHRVDGLSSARIFVRHHARLSKAEAGRRAQSAAVLAAFPAVREAFASGRIGIDHLARIGHSFANNRTRAELLRQDQRLADLASKVSFEVFHQRLVAWEALADEDGTRDRNQRHHQNRDFVLHQEWDGSWSIRGGGSALDGARIDAVFQAFLAAEEALDWEKARVEHGPDATADQRPRSEKQRRFDAFAHAMDLAAAGFAATEGGPAITTDLVIDHATFERETTRLTGAPVPPAEPMIDLDGIDDTDGTDGTQSAGSGTSGHRCSTLDGHALEATEAVAAALLGHIRRVVIGAESVAIDVGRKRRCFTGGAHLAVMLSQTWCYWPGCLVPAAQCQIDHLTPWSRGGRTDPGNGAPCCGTHNRLKEHGYTARRDPRGRVRTYRPDGTELT